MVASNKLEFIQFNEGLPSVFIIEAIVLLNSKQLSNLNNNESLRSIEPWRHSV